MRSHLGKPAHQTGPAHLHINSLYVYEAEMFKNEIQKSKDNIAQLNATQAGVEYLKLTNPNVIKNFKLFFNSISSY